MFIVQCSCYHCAPFEVSTTSLWVLTVVSISHWPFDVIPPPLSYYLVTIRCLGGGRVFANWNSPEDEDCWEGELYFGMSTLQCESMWESNPVFDAIFEVFWETNGFPRELSWAFLIMFMWSKKQSIITVSVSVLTETSFAFFSWHSQYDKRKARAKSSPWNRHQWISENLHQDQ